MGYSCWWFDGALGRTLMQDVGVGVYEYLNTAAANTHRFQTGHRTEEEVENYAADENVVQRKRLQK